MYSANKKLTVINFFGGPGCGKSTTAADLFARMKRAGSKVELVHEVAKDLIWEKQHDMFFEQDWIFAHQHRLIRRLVAHDIDYAIVDSSILLGIFYMRNDFPESFKQYIRDAFDSYDNLNVFLERNPNIPYVQVGRNESEQQAVEMDIKIRQYFSDNQIPAHSVLAGDAAASDIHTLAVLHRVDKS